MRQRESKWFVQGHTASRWRTQDFNYMLWLQSSPLFPLLLHGNPERFQIRNPGSRNWPKVSVNLPACLTPTAVSLGCVAPGHKRSGTKTAKTSNGLVPLLLLRHRRLAFSFSAFLIIQLDYRCHNSRFCLGPRSSCSWGIRREKKAYDAIPSLKGKAIYCQD